MWHSLCLYKFTLCFHIVHGILANLIMIDHQLRDCNYRECEEEKQHCPANIVDVDVVIISPRPSSHSTCQ